MFRFLLMTLVAGTFGALSFMALDFPFWLLSAALGGGIIGYLTGSRDKK